MKVSWDDYSQYIDIQPTYIHGYNMIYQNISITHGVGDSMDPLVSLWRVLTPKDPDINWVVVEPYPSEKYDFVSWDDEIANMMGKNNPNVANHQPVNIWRQIVISHRH